MARLSWLLGTTGMAIAWLGAGCGGDSFSATGGSGGTTQTATGGATSTGGTGGVTSTGGSGGSATTGGTGGSTGGTATGGTATGGAGGAVSCQPLSDPCAQCAYAACEDQYCACYAHLDCAALVNCISPCDPADTNCQQPCLTMYKDYISQVFLLGDCAAGPCGGSCMGVATVPQCPKCLFTKCPMQMNECLADPDCNDIINCAAMCAPNDISCAFACANGKPQTATNKALAVQSCAGDSNKCKPDCGG